MSSKKKQKKLSFIAKIKTISIVTGVPSKEDPSVCEHCHGPIDEHAKLLVNVVKLPKEVFEALVEDSGPKPKSKPKKLLKKPAPRPSEDISFAE
jgi:hypothetical protein